MMYLPRLCEHCLNPACVAACPSGAIYKREEDGIVLIDQDKCRGWRMCVSGCPTRRSITTGRAGKSEKCIFCYPRIEAGQPTVCSETCVGRIRYLGVMLYDADRIEAAASVPRRAGSLPGAARHLPRSERSGRDRAGAAPTACRRPGSRRRSARRSGRWRWSGRSPSRFIPNTGRCRWSGTCRRCRRSSRRPRPARSAIDGEMPDVRSLRIPLKYLANLLTAGKEEPVALALERMLAMRGYMRAKTVDGVHRREHRRARRPHRAAHRGHVPDHGDRQLRGSLRHPDRASRDRRGRLSICAARAASPSATAAPAAPPKPTCSARRQARQDADGGRCDDANLQGAVGAADLSDGGASAGGPGDRAAIDREALLPAAVRRQLDPAAERDRDRRSLRPAGALRAAVRPHALAVAASVRACAWREPRSRPGDDRPQEQSTRAHGLEIGATELPDFVPLFLEFLSTRPRAEARTNCSASRHISCAAMAERLRKRQSAYEAVFRALGALAATKPKGEDISALLAEPDPDAGRPCGARRRLGGRAGHLRAGRQRVLQGRADREIRAGRRPAPGVVQARPVPSCRAREESTMREASTRSCSAGTPISA